jgi:Tfp pilus assembly protein PilP
MRWTILLLWVVFAFSPLGQSRADVAAVQPPPAEMLKLRDPFRRPEIRGPEGIAKTELEMFPAEQLRLVAVVTGPERLRAMILAPNGKNYFVSVKTKVGTRDGVVSRITADSVRIQEKVVNVLGQEEKVETVIHLASEVRTSAMAGAGAQPSQ